MQTILSLILPFLVYWVILFVACYIVVEWGQNYLYDEATPAAGLKVAIGTLIFAAILTWARTRFDTMLTSELSWTVLQAIVWFAVFTLIFRFQPVHAFAIGVVAFLLLSGIATLAISSLTGTNPSGAPANRQPSKPLRRTLGPSSGGAPASKDGADAKIAPVPIPAPGGKPAEKSAP